MLSRQLLCPCLSPSEKRFRQHGPWNGGDPQPGLGDRGRSRYIRDLVGRHLHRWGHMSHRHRQNLRMLDHNRLGQVHHDPGRGRLPRSEHGLPGIGMRMRLVLSFNLCNGRRPSGYTYLAGHRYSPGSQRALHSRLWTKSGRRSRDRPEEFVEATQTVTSLFKVS